MNFPNIETNRLFLKVYMPEDVGALHAIRNDPDVYRYFRKPYSPPPVEEIRNGITRHHQRWQKYNFGEFGVFEKISKKLIGYCGLTYLDDTAEIEIYYGFTKQHWGKGFATEAARAVLKFAFDQLKSAKIVAVTNPKNLASQKVLEKLGLKLQGQINCYQTDCLYFSILRETFAAAP